MGHGVGNAFCGFDTLGRRYGDEATETSLPLYRMWRKKKRRHSTNEWKGGIISWSGIIVLTNHRLRCDINCLRRSMGSNWFSPSICAHPELLPSQEIYKFGDSRQFPSTGSVMSVWAAPIFNDSSDKKRCAVRFAADIAWSDIPLLLSISPMQLMNVTIDYRAIRLIFEYASTTPLAAMRWGLLNFEFNPLDSHNYLPTEEY